MIPLQHQNYDDPSSKKFYTIESLAAGRVLDVSQDANNQGQLIIYDSHKG
jgi:hypothetical protein